MRAWIHYTLPRLAKRELKLDLVLKKADGSKEFLLARAFTDIAGQDGRWLLHDKVFEMTPEHKQLSVMVDAKHSLLRLDDLLIQPEGVHHLRTENGTRVLDTIKLDK